MNNDHDPGADSPATSRRNLLKLGGFALGAGVLGAAPAAAASGPPPQPVDEGAVGGGQVSFPSIQAVSEPACGRTPNPDPPTARVGFAIMGLGRLALENILPAFSACKHARPVALISGNADKMRTVAGQYGIAADACYSYQDFARIRRNAAVDVVYVVLPNSLHHDAVVQAAAAGKHVLCEKPMAVDAAEARSMIEACKRADRKLMIAYRCQYEVANRELARRARAGEFGQIQFVDAVNTQNQGDPTQWRQVSALAGGGSLPDVGLYCLNTTRALLGEEPVEVSARIFSPLNDVRFKEVESTVSFTLRFASGVIANCASSYSVHEYRNMRVLGASATAELEKAFAYEGQRLRISRLQGAVEGDTALSLPRQNQFSLEIDHMAQCVRRNQQPRTPGEEGLQDQVIMAAIYESARTGRPVTLPAVAGIDPFRGPMPIAPA